MIDFARSIAERLHLSFRTYGFDLQYLEPDVLLTACKMTNSCDAEVEQIVASMIASIESSLADLRRQGVSRVQLVDGGQSIRVIPA